MKAAPLTAAERAWLSDLANTFARCPSKRLGAYTIGDAGLTFYDTEVLAMWQHADTRLDPGVNFPEECNTAGAVLSHIATGFNIDGVSG